MEIRKDELPVVLNIDFQEIDRMFNQAFQEGRNYLFEYEAYDLIRNIGAETPPKTHLIVKGLVPSDEELLALPGDKVVLKIVSPYILHKTEVGGVKVVEKESSKIRSAWRRMLYEVPENYAVMIERNPAHCPDGYRGLEGDALRQAVSRDVKGVLMVQFMPPDSEAFGNEMIVGIRNTREFGMVISAGLGGTDTELYAERFRKGQAIVAASTVMTGGMAFFNLFKQTISYKKLAGLTRGQRRIVTDEQLIECFAALIELANRYSPTNPEAPFVIEELEYNPFAFSDYLMVPLDGLAKFSLPGPQSVGRPIGQISGLLKPESIGIVGVSTTRVNFGRIILDNVLQAGFPKEKVFILRPGMDSFEGVTCVPDLASLDKPLDLLVVAVPSAKVPDVVEEVLTHDAARSVILIPGGMGETEESKDRAAGIMARIDQSRLDGHVGPVFLGANSVGVLSHPGNFDTLFIPEEKVPKQRGKRARNAAFVSQSGAFMMTRLSCRPELDPAYLISIGNQNDLTIGDVVTYLTDDPEIAVIGVYAEGFKDLDGLSFGRAVRKAVLAGKDVVFYKAGRTPEGKTATSGHTASLAGDYMVCESCVRQAGGMVAQNIAQFEDLFLLAQRLHSKPVSGNRLALISSAGFEAVAMADSLQSDDYRMKLADFSPATMAGLDGILAANKLSGLVEAKNPFDVTPAGDDRLHVNALQVFDKDPNVDAMVLSICPVSPGLATLPLDADDPRSFNAPNSIAVLLPKLAPELTKPLVTIADAGNDYISYVKIFMDHRIAVMPSADRAVSALGLYIQNRLYAESIRESLLFKTE
ncbi:MAG: acetate--CoA ligase family protein [Desulfatibacillum sp.]|nr:acetate--CoA ligase family protein [Desulfatibacillum sp.]